MIANHPDSMEMTQTAKKRIMVVEDESITALSIKRSLEKMGYAVTAMVSKGEDAIQKAQDDHHDLIIMDIMLAGVIDGIDTAAKIRSRFDIPIVYLTAYSDENVLKRIKRTNPFGYIIKPFEHRELRVAIEMALYKHSIDKKLKESEKKFRTLFEHATDAIYLIDPETQRVQDCNSKAAESLGYSVKQLKMMKVSDLHPMDEQEIVTRIFSKVNDNGPFTGISDINQITRDGKKIPVEINAASIDINGKNHNLAIIRDITDRKRAEDTLRNERNKLISILESMEDGVYIVNQDHDIEYVNPALMKEKSAFRGRKCFEYLYGRKSACSWCKSKKIFSGKTVHLEWVSPVDRRSYDIFATPLVNPDGTMSELKILHDITEHKLVEKKLHSASVTDELTGLFNRRGFFTLAEQYQKLADRNNRNMALLYIDLDDMKTINDKFGHSEGDNAIVNTAKILKRTFRKSDIVSRIGGDEFAVLLTEPKNQKIENVVKRNIKKELDAYNANANHTYMLKLSMGMAHYDPASHYSIDNLLIEADNLMYKNKRTRKSAIEQEVSPAEIVEKRRHKRFIVPEMLQVKIEGLGKVILKDISVGGLCMISSKQIELDSVHWIDFSGTDMGDMRPAGQVVWTSRLPASKKKGVRASRYETGLKFVDLGDVTRTDLGKMIDTFSAHA